MSARFPEDHGAAAFQTGGFDNVSVAQKNDGGVFGPPSGPVGVTPEMRSSDGSVGAPIDRLSGTSGLQTLRPRLTWRPATKGY